MRARWSPSGARLALLAVALGSALLGAGVAHRAAAFELWRSEQRYRDVGRWVADHAGADAVLLAVQHSGALAYYTRAHHRPLRRDCRRTISIGCVEQLAAAGRDVWLVADDWEEPQIRRRFASQARGGLDWAPIAEARVGPARVRVYDLATPTRATGPALCRGHRRRLAVGARSPRSASGAARRAQ